MRGAQAGFSVIEALVAVAIIAIALLPLAALQGQVSRAAAQQQTLQLRLAAERNALAVLKEVNPMREGEGVRDLGGGRTLRWTAVPISETAPNRAGGFEVALYRLEVQIADANGAAVSMLTLDQVGWRSASADDPR
jgi:general secretion pathway protein I